ncbi:YggT family protein [Pacificimonas sp. WHA3]|uniref:YggT family protein n=1 Tax=Pacificimonas pallii TaxID=2827236 RepID=A0ABS6SD91_9SPHN|nr:YggT family protein [Pacificimonas pallii]MBV7256068.1 YggT family protein [Pacificimonas pallii]
MPATIAAFLDIFVMLCQLLIWIIIAQVVLSWLIAFNVINLSNNFVRSIAVGIERLTAPLYAPIRRFMPDLGGIDLSPMVLMLAIILLQRFVPALVMDLVL